MLANPKRKWSRGPSSFERPISSIVSLGNSRDEMGNLRAVDAGQSCQVVRLLVDCTSIVFSVLSAECAGTASASRVEVLLCCRCVLLTPEPTEDGKLVNESKMVLIVPSNNPFSAVY